MKKPERITELDWQILKDKYPNQLEKIVEKIENNYPVQYLIGNVEFCDSIIFVDESVLIPRFETEYLVEKILNKIKDYKENSLEIIDIGTGSGCIVISLAKKIKQNFSAIDISESALKLAKENANANKVNINFERKDILKEKLIKKYDILISNPPYVAKEEKVDPQTQYEPQNAIFANKDGLEFYEKIIENLEYKPKLIAFEIGINQGEDIKKIAKRKFPDAVITIEKDLTNRPRYLFIE